MDNNQQEVLNGLFHSIEDLKARLAALEAQAGAFRDALAAAPAAEPVAPVPVDDAPIDLSTADIGLIDIPDIIPVAEAEEIPGQARNDEEGQARNKEEQVPDDDLPEAEPIVEPAPEPEPEPVAEPVAEPEPEPEHEPVAAPPAAPEPVAEPEPAPAPAPRGKSLVDLAAEKLAWKTDFPGIRVKNIRSAISLVDRAQFIGKLFGEDFALYDKTITELNEVSTLDEAVRYVTGHFPEWDLRSDLVYSFMMAIRKKLG